MKKRKSKFDKDGLVRKSQPVRLSDTVREIVTERVKRNAERTGNYNINAAINELIAENGSEAQS